MTVRPRREGLGNRNQPAVDRFDILIVGGGIAGASLAARLAPSRRVLLVEAEEMCGTHATGRSAAFWQASLGGDTPERRLSILSKPMFDAHWPGADVPLLHPRIPRFPRKVTPWIRRILPAESCPQKVSCRHR